MGLEKYLEKAVAKTRVSFSSNKEKWTDYLTKYELKDYFEGVPDERKEQLRNTLENKLEEARDRFKTELGGLRGLGRKVVSKGSMLGLIANDFAAYFTKVGLWSNSALIFPAYAIKTLSELPALYRYVKKTKDWYGALKHSLLKPIRMIIPFLGAALESGSFDRMVRKRVLKEAKYSFIKEIGKYIPMKEKVKEKLKKPLFEVISDTSTPYVPRQAA